MTRTRKCYISQQQKYGRKREDIRNSPYPGQPFQLYCLIKYIFLKIIDQSQHILNMAEKERTNEIRQSTNPSSALRIYCFIKHILHNTVDKYCTPSQSQPILNFPQKKRGYTKFGINSPGTGSALTTVLLHSTHYSQHC